MIQTDKVIRGRVSRYSIYRKQSDISQTVSMCMRNIDAMSGRNTT